MSVLGWSGGPFLEFYGVAAVIAFALALVALALIGTTGRVIDTRSLTALDIAYLAGGMRRAADTFVLELLTRGGASLSAAPSEITILSTARGRAGGPDTFRSVFPGTYSHKELRQRFAASSGAGALTENLVHRNLVLAPDRRLLSRIAIVLILGPLLALGLAKVVTGLERGRPVGFLLMLIALVLFAGMRLLWPAAWLTRESRSALANLRSRESRVIRAPRDHEVPLAFALAGATALAGTAHAAYGALLGRSGSENGGSDGGGCDGGGGGCGGCGS